MVGPVSGRTARTVLARLGSALLVLWGAVTVTFIGLHLVKGDPVDAILGGTTQISPQVREQITREYRLDDPVLLQYGHYLERLLHGDLGQSYVLRMPVSSAIGAEIGNTFALLASATVLALVGATVVALLTAHRSPWLRGPVQTFEVVTIAVPSFWLGILLLSVFSFRLNWFPAVGAEGVRGLVLPAVTLAAAPGAMFAQVLRQGLERTLEEPFVVTARTRGLGQTAVLLRHVLRHALLPVVTLAGWLAGAMIGGAVITEQVFSRPGLGRLSVAAITGRDLPLVIGVVLIAAGTYVVINLAVDLLYRALDPRLSPAARPVDRLAEGDLTEKADLTVRSI
jgi:peptide/nickel transport system permease protein